MKRQITGVLLAAGIVLAVCTATAMPATAATSGSETFSLTIVTSGISGTRTVISSVIIAKGVFSGVGHIVELPGQPGDPANVDRDDLVFPEGTMHLLTTHGSASFTLNPHNCLFSGTQQQTSEVTGGTGPFAAATGSFTGAARGQGLLPRNPDGSCAFGQPSLHEEDLISTSGTLSF